MWSEDHQTSVQMKFVPYSSRDQNKLVGGKKTQKIHSQPIRLASFNANNVQMEICGNMCTDDKEKNVKKINEE